MPIPKSTPIRLTPRGLSDAFDSSDLFPGACRRLQNLVFDPVNPNLVIARPGVGSTLTTFSGVPTAGFISVQITLGNLVFGMIASSLNAGNDQPFCYNLATNTFVTISGITAANTPVSPTTSGAWTPPTMAVIGVKIIVTHPGFSGTTNVFGIIDITTVTTPTWSSGNMATNPLPSVPSAVSNFNNRAYYAIGNKAYYSNVLDPLTATNAGQSLTLGDNTPIVAFGGLPVQTTSSGVVGALLVFKASQVWQITGDAAITNSLAQNFLSLSVGTLAPRSVAASPIGTFFLGPDTVYLINPYALPIPVAYNSGSPTATPDLRQPFQNVTVPSRAAAAFASNIYRVSLTSVVDNAAGAFDYWFDTRHMRWNGPHSFAYDCASSSSGTSFILSGAGLPAKLFQSFPAPQNGQSYLDNGQQYTCILRSAELPKRDEMTMKQVVESTLELTPGALPTTYQIIAYDESGSFLANAGLITQFQGAFWGSNNWGDGSVWSSTTQQTSNYNLPWQIPLVFNQISVEVTCTAGAFVSIGTFYARAQFAGYTQMFKTK